MSFGKAKRFSYSSDFEGKSVNRTRGKDKCDSTITEEGKRSTKYTIYFPPDSMLVRSPIRCDKNRRRIDTKLYHRNSFNDSEYFVDEAGNITQEADEAPGETPPGVQATDGSYGEFRSGLDRLGEDPRVGREVEDALEKIRADGVEKIRGFTEDFAEWNDAVVEEVKDKLRSLIEGVKRPSEDEVKGLTSMLLRRLEEAEASSGVHEERLNTIDEKIERQAVVINALASVIQCLPQWLNTKTK